MDTRRKLSVIYDITKVCPWNCAICCMGAESTAKAKENELPLSRKLSLMDDLGKVNMVRDVHIDFSGGEIFTNMENLMVVEKAADILGKSKVGISSSGFGITEDLAKRLSYCIKDCEMTMDIVPGCRYALRPYGYAIAAEKALPYLKKYGIGTGIQTVLAHSNCNEKNLSNLYKYLCDAGVDNWSLLKFYPSGRGASFAHEALTAKEEAWVVDFILNMDAANISKSKPAIDFHYTMKGHNKYTTECRCVRKSIGILPDGTVTACFWAIDDKTGIVEPKFNLGSVKTNSLNDILEGEKAKYWMACPHKCELFTGSIQSVA